MDVKQQGVDPSKSPYRLENRKASGMPELRELLDRYAEIVGLDPSKGGGGKDWEVATIFQHVRGATTSQGIQARTISGQNSSTSSHLYFAKTKQSLDAAFQRVQNLREQKVGRKKL
jgi:aminoglycoside phosphotransferase (APT) family kinase protein